MIIYYVIIVCIFVNYIVYVFGKYNFKWFYFIFFNYKYVIISFGYMVGEFVGIVVVVVEMY